MALTSDSQDEIRDKACGAVSTPLGEFAGLDEDVFTSAVIAAVLATAEGNEASEDDLKVILAWANKVHMQATALHFVLIGAAEARVVDEEVCFRMAHGSPDEMMRQLVRHGVAKKAESDSCG